MKILKNITYALAAVAVLAFASCKNNDQPSFNSGDSFYAFTSNTMSVSETGGKLNVPVSIVSMPGHSGSVKFDLLDSASVAAKNYKPAIEGKHFNLVDNVNQLTFTGDSIYTKYINVEIIDNDEYEGDVVFGLRLYDPQNGNLGAMDTIFVTISDDEHPLAYLLGTYNATAVSYFSGEAEDWTAEFTKDTDDPTVVWIYPFAKGGQSSAYPVYGNVVDQLTDTDGNITAELHIPVNQITASSSSYPVVRLEGWFGEDGDEDITDYIVGYINYSAASGTTTITIRDWFGAHAYTDEAATSSAGWYCIYQYGAVFTLQK